MVSVEAEAVEAAVTFSDAWGFQRKRRAIRERLAEHEIAERIDAAVTTLLLETAPPEAVDALTV